MQNNTGNGKELSRNFISACRQTANWLSKKSRAKGTAQILKVSREIVRRQDRFFFASNVYARSISRRSRRRLAYIESTVSRVTSNKYMATPRGLFELKYFFTASIAAHDGGAAHSAYFVEEVRKDLESRYGAKQLYENGLSVQTGLDVRLQEAASAALDAGLRRVDKRRGFRKPRRNIIAEGKSIDAFRVPAGITRWPLATSCRRSSAGPRARRSSRTRASSG